MLLITYYELNADDALLSLIDSFKTYVNRHKDIAQDRRTLYLNLMKYTKKLMKLNKGDLIQIENIKKEMEEDRKIGITSEKWIRGAVGQDGVSHARRHEEELRHVQDDVAVCQEAVEPVEDAPSQRDDGRLHALGAPAAG